MTTITMRNEIPYKNCCVSIPVDMRELARLHRISMSAILIEGIRKEVALRGTKT